MKQVGTFLLLLFVLMFALLYVLHETNLLTLEAKEETLEKKISARSERAKQKMSKEAIQMNLLERQRRAEAAGEMNVYSQLGESLSEHVETISKKLLVTAMSKLNEWLNRPY